MREPTLKPIVPFDPNTDSLSATTASNPNAVPVVESVALSAGQDAANAVWQAPSPVLAAPPGIQEQAPPPVEAPATTPPTVVALTQAVSDIPPSAEPTTAVTETQSVSPSQTDQTTPPSDATSTAPVVNASVDQAPAPTSDSAPAPTSNSEPRYSAIHGFGTGNYDVADF
ncbi:hypothetical protein BC830DRAFT_953210 [Chytriomyces sp. MP71]|nr:hypothetical protein BC830DRAFT_953210 [Chytriomyces sp. MP71]